MVRKICEKHTLHWFIPPMNNWFEKEQVDLEVKKKKKKKKKHSKANMYLQFSSVQLLNRARLFATA